jgi:hypothetical protein
MIPASNQRGMTFHWEVKRRWPTVLPGFILISLIVHAATFFVFRVTYPPQASMAAPPPAVTVLDPRRPDHQALLRWIEAEDPSPGISASNAITDRLLQVDYKASYAAPKTPPLMLPEDVPRAQFPPARDPLSIIRSAEPKPPAPVPLATGDSTRVTFAGNLQQRIGDRLPPFSVTKKSAVELEQTAFLVGVDAHGTIKYVMPQFSSGDAALDGEAQRYLEGLKLAPGAPEISWGRATIQWGSDAYTSPKGVAP